MNIAVVAADLLPDKLGGAEAHVVEIIKILSRRHRFFLFVGEDISIKTVFPRNVEIYGVKYPKIPNLYGLSYILFGYQQINSVLKSKNFDLIWAKQSYPQAPLGVLLKRSYKKPLYVTAQNPLLHQEELVIKGSILKPFQKLISSFLTPLISWSLKNADLVACVSKYSESLAQKMGSQKTVIIPNGVDSGQFSAKKDKKGTQINLLTTSSLIPRNGLDVLLKAVSLLPSKLNYRLVIAGDGPLRAELEKLSAKLGIAGKVEFLGRVNNRQIPKLLLKADIFVRPSRREGFGVSFLEAMAGGVPVIATPVGGIVDFIKNMETGISVPVDDPTALAKAMKNLILDKNLYRKLKFNGKNLVVNHYSWSRIAYEVERRMEQLV